MSKISFFNKAVFKRNIHGYWPLWAVYLGAMILLIPVPLYSNLQYGYYENAAEVAHSYFGNALTGSLIFGAFFAIFATMAVFSYMYTSRAANMTASLPIRREALFSTNFISVMFVTVAVHVITAVITIFTIALLDIELLYILPILQWIVLGVLVTLFFVCLSFFCATLTGNILILPCIYGVINFSVVLINTILSNVFGEFLYGYSANTTPEIVMWLTPSVKLLSIVTGSFKVSEGRSYINFNNANVIVIYTIIGILFLIAAFFIHKNRRTESASDIIAVKPLKPIVKYFFAGIGSLTLGILINELFFPYTTDSFIGYIISMIIGGFFGYFASEMLVTKSFKVWHKWKGYAVYCLAVILFITGLAFDITGFETSIPKEDSIAHAHVDIYGETLEGDDAETINTILNLHDYIIENRDKEIDYDAYCASVDISYMLKGGTYVKRTYYCNIPDFIVDVYNSPQNCFERVAISDEFTITGLVQAYIEYNNGYEWNHNPLTNEQFQELYNCMMLDIGHSSLGRLSFGSADYIPDVATLGADYKISEYSGEYYYYQGIPADAENTLAYLATIGIVPNN